VDEVLAVGDATFQKKCLGKLGNVAKQGRTVLFVSHNMTALRILCNRAILLSKGSIDQDGVTDNVINTYLYSGRSEKAEINWDKISEAPGNDIFRLHSVCIKAESGIRTSRIGSDHQFNIEIEYWNLRSNTALGATVVLYNQDGVCVLSSISNHDVWHGRARPEGLFCSICHIPGSFLAEGRYSVTVLIFAENYSSLYKEDEIIRFDIYDTGAVRGDYFGGFSGVVRPFLKWTTKHIDNNGHQSLSKIIKEEKRL
jgi:lipopolysaccharide transport system ATP-binding protein